MKYLIIALFFFHGAVLYAQNNSSIAFHKKNHPKHNVKFSLPQYVKFKPKKGEKYLGFLTKCQDSVLTFIVYNHTYTDNDGNTRSTYNGFGDELRNKRTGDSTVITLPFSALRVIHFSRNRDNNGNVNIAIALFSLAVFYGELQVLQPLYKLKETNSSNTGVNILYYVALCADGYLIVKTWRYIFKPIRPRYWQLGS